MTRFQQNVSCWAVSLTFDFSILWHTEEFVVDFDCKVSRSRGTECDIWYEAFALICCVWFPPNMALRKDIVPEVL